MPHPIKTLLLILSAAGVCAFAELNGSYMLPLDHEAIQYAKAPVDDPIARLEKRMARGEVKLQFENNGMGHLRSLLKALHVNIDSQVVVFSKTSFQAPRISPRMPRAIYFSDDVSVGWVRGGEVLELAALDPRQGVVFYTIDIEDVAKPRFERRDTACLQCHQSGGSLGVPGLFIRSVVPELSGMPLFRAGTFLTDHRSPMKERWGGWYVSGKHGSDVHMGNAVVRDRENPDQLETEDTQNQTSLARKFDTAAYFSPHSDIVALMTLEHQARMTNLMTRVAWEARIAPQDRAAIDAAVDEMLEYMLFVDEAPIKDPIEGVSTFSRTFPQRGPRDRLGRSLRDFDLQHRTFKYPLSYMIYSEAFDAMPASVRERLYRRLYEVLTGADRSGKFASLPDQDRRAIFEILLDTKPNLPDYWHPPG